VTLYEHAHQFMGMREIPGAKHHPWIVWAFTLCGLDATDEDAWCSAAMNGWAYGVPNCPRSRSARARSWLNEGKRITLAEAVVGWDVLIFQRGEGPQPGPNVIDAPGHVGLYAGHASDDNGVLTLGGNQGNEVTIARYPVAKLIGVRRLFSQEIER
jgi:uncharacterized protein (TIGR02594 family)